jgi:ABC-type transporter Mla MlaB component
MKKPVQRAVADKGGSKSAKRHKPAKAKRAAKAKPVARVKSNAKARAGAKVRAGAVAPPESVALVDAVAQEPVAAQADAVPAAPSTDAFFLTLDASCTLRETADMQFSLVVATGDPVVVDGGAVERIDTAGLQLLVALVRRQQQAGRRLEWKAVSRELRTCGERLGLIEALGIAPAAGDTP